MMDVYGHTLFCEEIREERSGQFTVIGAFPNDIVVSPNIPAFVPKFSLMIYLYIKKSMHPKAVSINVSFDDESVDPDISLPVPIDEGQWTQGSFETAKKDPIYVRIQNNIVLNAFPFTKNNGITVHGNCDGVLTRIGRIKIIIASEENGLAPNIQTLPTDVSRLEDHMGQLDIKA
jgi:hypothetical protein